jgi:hypothetical protein
MMKLAAVPALIVALLLAAMILDTLVASKEVKNEGTQDQVCQNSDDNPQDGSCRVVLADATDDGEGLSSKADAAPVTRHRVADECRIVMAPSTIARAGWGVFSLVDMRRGMPILPGDLVIQVTDLNPQHADGMTLMLHDYLWDASETGGFYEGKQVASALPGVGLLANGLSENQHNVLPFVPTVDEGGLTRIESPGAGALTHYYNLTFFSSKDLTAGSEIFCNYGSDWFRERQLRLASAEEVEAAPAQHSTEWLRQQGRCLDNIRSGQSRIPHAGRGAFATRHLDAGDIAAPVPVLVITKRQAFDLFRQRDDGTTIETKQLLLNYCLRHANSSILLYPYSPMVNMVNHAPSSRANVRLQWSESNELHKRGKKWLTQPLEAVKNYNQSGLLLELVATRDINNDEEILLDYGVDWQNAWTKHVKEWKPLPDAGRYTPSYVMEDVVNSLRTELELKDHPYPENLFTSCFYRYADHKNEAEKNSGADGVTTFRWDMTRGLFDLRNLRPCKILQREQDPKQGTLFTVRILNRYGLAKNERIPRGGVHIVTHVPRRAIRFSDKIYTTDQHLENAFRHEIGIPDDIYPKQWKDME